MIENILIHTKNGNVIYTKQELIENALKQEKEGIKPHYAFYDYKKKEAVTSAGWLVFSTAEDGAGVVYRRDDGKMIFCNGRQGEICYI